MKQYYEELRPASGETFQIYIHNSTTEDKKYTLPHMHDFIEVLYCLKGTYKLCVNDFETTFKVGDMIVVGAKNIHEIYIQEGKDGEYNGDLLAIKFQPEMIYANFYCKLDLKYVLPFIFSNTKANYFFSNEQLEKTKLKSTLLDIKNELVNHEYGYEIALKSGIFQVILHIIRFLHSSKKIGNEFSLDITQKLEVALNYIETNYARPISVKELSDISFMEYTYFSRVFKQLTGMNCTKYINQIRVKKSEPMLLSDNMSISKISEEVGFDNISYYIKQFKQLNGVSPKQYRKMFLSNNEEEK